jgi:peptide/nickel transport system permease protein
MERNPMGHYIFRRLLWTLFTLFGVSLLTFILIFAGPTDPANALVGERAQGVSVEHIRQQYGLDRPIYIQYLNYMGNLLQGNLGDSFYFRRPVSETLLEKFPATALLAVSIIVVAVLLGIPMGIIAALKHNTVVDHGLMIFQLLTISLPTFFLGLLMIYFFAFRLDLFPVGGYGSFSHLVLPTLSVALPWAAWYAIFLRSNLLDVIGADYVRTAYAKGLGQKMVVLRHMLRNAILPVLTMVGMDLATLLAGIALVEYIFNWPGIGWQALQAAQHLDVPLIMGSVLFGALFIGLGNLFVDLLYTWLDPRVQAE